jgi:hypothetical protein
MICRSRNHRQPISLFVGPRIARTHDVIRRWHNLRNAWAHRKRAVGVASYAQWPTNPSVSTVSGLVPMNCTLHCRKISI